MIKGNMEHGFNLMPIVRVHFNMIYFSYIKSSCFRDVLPDKTNYQLIIVGIHYSNSLR